MGGRRFRDDRMLLWNLYRCAVIGAGMSGRSFGAYMGVHRCRDGRIFTFSLSTFRH